MNDRHRASSPRAIWTALAAAVAAVVVVHVLLVPASGIDRKPPECYSYFGYVVPCGSGLWVGTALVSAAVLGAVVYMVVQRRNHLPE